MNLMNEFWLIITYWTFEMTKTLHHNPYHMIVGSLYLLKCLVEWFFLTYKAVWCHLIYKSKHGVRLSVATKTRRGPETSKVLKTFEDLNRGVCLSVTTNSAGQGQGRTGQGQGQDRARQGQGRAGQPWIFFFFWYWPRLPFFFFFFFPSRLRGRIKCPSGLMTGRI